MKVHLLGLAHTETTQAWEFCAFTARTRVLASMLTAQGHDVRLYAGEANEATVAEHVPLMDREEQQRWYPWYDGSQVFNDFDPAGEGWRTFNQRAIAAIRERCQPGDVLGITMGLSHKPVADALPELRAVEVGIGYSGVFAPFRVFESAAWRHYLAAREPTDDLRWFDAVIPRAYEVDDFPAGKGRGGYLLFVGRLMARKGPTVAAELARRTGVRLLVAGQGVASAEPGRITAEDGTVLEGDVQHVGVVGPEERARLMGEALAVVMPTSYLEPGGGVAIEAQLCGTPVLTVPWGAMTESVIEGVTGFHCSTLAEFHAGFHAAQQLDRNRIREVAMTRYGTGPVGRQWNAYLAKIASLAGEGWYAMSAA